MTIGVRLIITAFYSTIQSYSSYNIYLLSARIKPMNTFEHIITQRRINYIVSQ